MNKNKLTILGGTIAITTLLVGAFIIPTKQPLTFEEYYNLIKIYNYEIRQNGGRIKLNNPDKSIIKTLNEKILNSTQPAKIKLDSLDTKEYSTKEYQTLKVNLFEKIK